MISHPPLELRLELYSDSILDRALVDRISSLLSGRWPVSWDVKVPPRPSQDHPARWHAVVPRAEAETAQGLHQRLAGELLALDPSNSLRFRTRWNFLQTPNEQEIFEVRW